MADLIYVITVQPFNDQSINSSFIRKWANTLPCLHCSEGPTADVICFYCYVIIVNNLNCDVTEASVQKETHTKCDIERRGKHRGGCSRGLFCIALHVCVHGVGRYGGEEKIIPSEHRVNHKSNQRGHSECLTSHRDLSGPSKSSITNKKQRQQKKITFWHICSVWYNLHCWARE